MPLSFIALVMLELMPFEKNVRIPVIGPGGNKFGSSEYDL